MKTIIILFLFVFSVLLAGAQIGIGTTTPNSTLDVRGSLSVKMNTFSSSVAAGSDNFLVFTGSSTATLTLPDAATCQGRIYWIKNTSANASVLTVATSASQTIDGLSGWSLAETNKAIRVVSDGSNWLVTSEVLPGTTAGTPWLNGGNNVSSQQNFGTISNYAIPFITNNTEKMRLTASGSLGIGTSTFNGTYPERLLIDAGATGNTNYQNVVVGKGNTNSYAQLNIQNSNAGTAASSDVVATADNGNESINYIDLGINSSANSSAGVLGGINTAYLYSTGNDFAIGNGATGKNLLFFTNTGGTNTERMRIDGSGNVGIGTGSPAYKLQVNGVNPLFLNGVQTGAGTDSIMTIINGVVRKLHPSALTTSSSNAWALIGNAGTNANTNFLGTTDAQAFVIKENNTQVARFEANSIAFGNGSTTANSTHSYSFGSSAVIGYNKTAAYAIGSGAAVNADSSFAIGNNAVANGTNSMAIGTNAAANNSNSLAIGKSAVTGYSITDAVALGTNATVNASNAISIGGNSNTSNKTITNAASAIAIGTNAVSNSASSIALGTGSSTAYSLSPAIAIGNSAVVSGNSGVALGNGATVGFVANATALGTGASVTNVAANSTALGYNASATLANEIILGDRSSTVLSVGIGTESFSSSNREKLLVDAGATGSVNAIVGKGTIDSYLQLNIQNNSSGTFSSSDVVATANNGNELSNYIDMGINGGSYSGGVMGAANDGYLYTMGNNFLLGTANTGKSLVFMTGGTAQATNERMRVDGNGNVGINTTNPGNKLEVNSGTGGASGLRLKQLPQGAVLFMSSTNDVTQNNNNLYFDATNYRLSVAGGTTPNSTMQVGGSLSMAITTKTANYTVGVNDYTIICNNTSGGITIGLPAASGCTGRIYVIKKISPMFNNVVIDPSGSETVDGNATRTLTNQYETVTVQSDGTSWYIL